MFPENLWKITSLTRKKATAIFLLFGLITGIPYATASIQSMEIIGKDMQIISERLPAFMVEGGELKLQENLNQALVVKSDSANFIINREKAPSQALVQREIERAPISFLMERTYLRIATPETHFDLSYSLLEGMTEETLKAMLTDFGSLNAYTLIPVMIVSFLVGIIDGAFQIVLIALMANILSLLFQMRLPFSQNFKLVLVASFIPTLILTIMNVVGIFPAAQTAIISMITLYIYYKGIVQHIRKL